MQIWNIRQHGQSHARLNDFWENGILATQRLMKSITSQFDIWSLPLSQAGLWIHKSVSLVCSYRRPATQQPTPIVWSQTFNQESYEFF